tara:strand:- start:268 stop:672 length:405 start_codon:yes stop_codon:yes gene_type:complete
MKKLLTILIVLLFSVYLNAQGTLQFDHVEYIELSIDPSVSSNSSQQIITVAPNTVWKIVSATPPTRKSSNNVLYYKEPKDDAGVFVLLNNSVISNNEVPVWLKEGSYVLEIAEATSGTTFYYSNISAIVFNIVP